MSLLQPESRKVNKRPKKKLSFSRNFKCSQCEKSYGSYPTLYLHIKQKHNEASQHEDQTQKTGRPKKPTKSIDETCCLKASIENAHDDLMWLLVEKLSTVKNMAPKEQLEIIQAKIKETCENSSDKWLTDLYEEACVFVSEYNQKDPTQQDLDFEEEFLHMDHSKSLRVLVWLFMWLGKLYVKIEFTPDVCLIFSRIWKALDEEKLGVEDLDNKLVWKKVMKDCEGLGPSLSVFRGNLELMSEFIEKVCQLVGKVFESQ